jgi:hypothetical protein
VVLADFNFETHQPVPPGRRDFPMDDAVAVPPSPTSPPSPQRPGAGTILTLVNGVLAGVGGVFVGTHSVLITIIAAAMAVALAAMILIIHR